MKFSREFYFHASFFRAFYFRPPLFFSFSRKPNFRATAKKSLVCQTKTSQMLVFSWYLVRERNKNQKILRTFSCANHSNSRGLYIRAGALRENKTHAKIS